MISWLTEDLKAAIVIFSMVVLSTLLRFWQESQSNQAADALKAMVSNTATVMRRDLRSQQRAYFAVTARNRRGSNCRSSNWCRAT